MFASISTVKKRDAANRADDHQREHPPLIRQKVTQRHENLGDNRQFAAELGQMPANCGTIPVSKK